MYSYIKYCNGFKINSIRGITEKSGALNLLITARTRLFNRGKKKNSHVPRANEAFRVTA